MQSDFLSLFRTEFAARMAVPTPAAALSTLTPALFRRLHPRPYLEKFLAEQVRPDGRTLDSSNAFRDASINQGQFHITLLVVASLRIVHSRK